MLTLTVINVCVLVVNVATMLRNIQYGIKLVELRATCTNLEDTLLARSAKLDEKEKMIQKQAYEVNKK